jgi:SAM-dependent methyltransferase
MKYRLFDFIQCPHCKNPYDVQVLNVTDVKYDKNEGLSDNDTCPSHCKNPDPGIKKTDDVTGHCRKCYESEITEGLLTCSCGKAYPIVRGVPRFLPDAFDQHSGFTEKYYDDIKNHADAISIKDKEHFRKMFKETQATFGNQWKSWGKSDRIYGFTDDENKEWFLRDLTSKDIDASYFKGKTILEVGCGHGRFVKILSGLCSEYFALDLGPSVDLAYEITRDRPNVHIMQANAMTPPLKEESFDYVWSHGVLHHTPSTKQAFDAVNKLPKKQTGRFYIWVYHKGGFIWEYGNRFGRSITTRLPASILKFISYALVPLLYLIPAYNKDVNLSNMSWTECALSVHDWLAPKYQWHHSAEEVMSWFKEKEYTDIEQTSANGVGITGVRK